MKYSKPERLDIGRRIYEGELTRFEAAEEYGISDMTARDYMRMYRDENQLPSKKRSSGFKISPSPPNTPSSLEMYQSMTKEELIQELIRSKIAEARLKKGYEVKGDGSAILYDNENTK